MESTPYESLSDEEVAQLCMAQLPYIATAFEEILGRYEAVVLRSCHRFLGNASEAEEACQDVFLRVFPKINQFEGRSSFRTWLYRIAFNVCLSRQKKLQKRYQHEVSGGGLSLRSAGTNPLYSGKTLTSANTRDRSQGKTPVGSSGLPYLLSENRKSDPVSSRRDLRVQEAMNN
jgi:RNA polymerase sigma factor (sigma-70 family)